MRRYLRLASINSRIGIRREEATVIKSAALRFAVGPAAVSLTAVDVRTTGLAWGRTGHVLINAGAAAELPDEIPAFTRTADAIDKNVARALRGRFVRAHVDAAGVRTMLSPYRPMDGSIEREVARYLAVMNSEVTPLYDIESSGGFAAGSHGVPKSRKIKSTVRKTRASSRDHTKNRPYVSRAIFRNAI